MAQVSTYDVAVIGGGVIGAACARAAALRQLETVILEPGPDPAAASPASAGMLAAQIEPSAELMLGLCVRGRHRRALRLRRRRRGSPSPDAGLTRRRSPGGSEAPASQSRAGHHHRG